MRELLKAAETVVDEYKGVPSSHFHSLLVKLEEAIAAAKERSKWVKVSDGLPVVPEGEKYVVVWTWSSLTCDDPGLQRWYWDMTAESTFKTHWQYRQDDTPAPPEDL